MSRFHLGQYSPGISVIHRLDPRVKILSVIALSPYILQMEGWTGLLLSGFLAGIFLLSRLPFSLWVKSLKPMAWFLAVIFLLHLFFAEGTPLGARFAFPRLSAGGFYRGGLIIWQFVLLIMSASLLTMTTSPSELILGLERILRPLRILRVPSHDLAMMVSLALRFMPLLLEEIDRMKTAQMARGANFAERNPLRRLQRITSLALPILIHVFLRAEELVDAMAGRGYRRGPRTYLRELRMTGHDYEAGAVVCGFFILLGLL